MRDDLMLNGTLQRIVGFGLEFDPLIDGQPIQHILFNGLLLNFPVGSAI